LIANLPTSREKDIKPTLRNNRVLLRNIRESNLDLLLAKRVVNYQQYMLCGRFRIIGEKALLKSSTSSFTRNYSPQIGTYDLSAGQIDAMSKLKRENTLIGNEYFDILWKICILDYNMKEVKELYSLKRDQAGKIFRSILKELKEII